MHTVVDMVESKLSCVGDNVGGDEGIGVGESEGDMVASLIGAIVGMCVGGWVGDRVGTGHCDRQIRNWHCITHSVHSLAPVSQSFKHLS